MNPSDTFGRIILSLHDAVLDDARRPAMSRPIKEACGTRGNSRLSDVRASGRTRAPAWTGCSPSTPRQASTSML